VSVGRGSLIVAPEATPGPLFVRVTVQENPVPAETVWVAGVFVMPRVPHPTVIDALAGDGAVPLPSVTVAVLG
jgi:hypothetical protein